MPHVPANSICELLDRYTAIVESPRGLLAETVRDIGQLVELDDIVTYCRHVQAATSRDDATECYSRIKRLMGKKLPGKRRQPLATEEESNGNAQ